MYVFIFLGGNLGVELLGISLVTNDVEYLFICLIDLVYLIWWNIYFKSFAHFQIVLPVLLSYKILLNIF